MDDLIKAVKSLISDIESMQVNSTSNVNWFGPFGVSSEDGVINEEAYTNIEWPNLAISVAKVKELLEPKTIEGELTKPMIKSPLTTADFGEIETRYLAQNAQAVRTMEIYQRKLIDRGFTIKGDLIAPPAGMGQFAFDEITQKLWKEAKEEASKPELKVVK